MAAIRNTVYCDKIFISKYKDDEDDVVHCPHEPLIDETFFMMFSKFLMAARKQNVPNISTDDHRSLRGFLLCPVVTRADKEIDAVILLG